MILAHFGGGYPLFSIMKKIRMPEHVRFDTAALPYLYDPALYFQVMEQVGEECLVFGSDWPLLSPSRYFRDMEPLSENRKTALKGGNLFRFLENPPTA